MGRLLKGHAVKPLLECSLSIDGFPGTRSTPQPSQRCSPPQQLCGAVCLQQSLALMGRGGTHRAPAPCAAVHLQSAHLGALLSAQEPLSPQTQANPLECASARHSSRVCVRVLSTYRKAPRCLPRSAEQTLCWLPQSAPLTLCWTLWLILFVRSPLSECSVPRVTDGHGWSPSRSLCPFPPLA